MRGSWVRSYAIQVAVAYASPVAFTAGMGHTIAFGSRIGGDGVYLSADLPRRNRQVRPQVHPAQWIWQASELFAGLLKNGIMLAKSRGQPA